MSYEKRSVSLLNITTVGKVMEVLSKVAPDTPVRIGNFAVIGMTLDLAEGQSEWAHATRVTFDDVCKFPCPLCDGDADAPSEA